MIEVGVDGFAAALSSTWTPSTTVAVNPHPRSNTLLLYTLFCSPWFRASRQGNNLEADGVQNLSTLSKPPTDRAGERHMCRYGRVNW